MREWEAAGEIGVVKKPDIPTIAKAVDKFFEDLKAQQLSSETIRKYQNLLNKRFLPWCESQGYRYLKQLGVEEMRQFRAGWTDSALYATKNLERLRSFFRFCMHDDWIARNPARSVKAPKVTDKPTLPFSRPEMARILAACDQYRGDQDRLRAFVLVMRHSGLRIGDTIALDERRLTGNKLLLYATVLSRAVRDGTIGFPASRSCAGWNHRLRLDGEATRVEDIQRPRRRGRGSVTDSAVPVLYLILRFERFSRFERLKTGLNR